MVERFAFTNTRAELISDVAGERTISVPDIKRQNIGDRATGLTPQQLSQALLQSVVEEVQRAVGKQLGKMAGDALEKKLSDKLDAGDKAKLEGLKSIFKKD